MVALVVVCVVNVFVFVGLVNGNVVDIVIVVRVVWVSLLLWVLLLFVLFKYC